MEKLEKIQVRLQEPEPLEPRWNLNQMVCTISQDGTVLQTTVNRVLAQFANLDMASDLMKSYIPGWWNELVEVDGTTTNAKVWTREITGGFVTSAYWLSRVHK